jgi:hypothetical protein
MSNATMHTLTHIQGIAVPVARPRPVAGAVLGTFPGRGAPTRWSEITGFPARHHY